MKSSSTYLIPGAIVIAGILIAGAYYLTNQPASSPVQSNGDKQQKVDARIPGVQPNDHIRGSRNAKLVVIEYSDLECPFCKVFHDNMKRLIEEYGKDGTVAWVYRHLPLEQLHSKAAKEAQASECATEQGGNDAFWDYTDRLFEITPSNNGLDLSRLPEIAEEIGLDRAQFETCLESGKTAEKVNSQMNEALSYARETGAQIGTPFNVFVVGNEQIVQPGALPYAALESIVKAALAGNASGADALNQ